jgi:hypothetical protein
MNSGDLNMVEARRQELLGQIKAAESALRGGLHTHGFGSTARAHLERALVNDLNRVQQVMDDARRTPHRSQHI